MALWPSAYTLRTRTKERGTNEKKIRGCRLFAEALPPPEGSGEVEVEFLEGYDSIEGPDGSMGFGVFVPTEEKIYIADDLPGGEESMIETVAHEWKHWLQYCNDEAYDEEEAEDFARQIAEEFL